jgi:hypothetical protein
MARLHVFSTAHARVWCCWATAQTSNVLDMADTEHGVLQQRSNG